MNEAGRIALLEKENSELREEIDILFRTVSQLRESVNLLVGFYILNESGDRTQGGPVDNQK